MRATDKAAGVRKDAAAQPVVDKGLTEVLTSPNKSPIPGDMPKEVFVAEATAVVNTPGGEEGYRPLHMAVSLPDAL